MPARSRLNLARFWGFQCPSAGSARRNARPTDASVALAAALQICRTSVLLRPEGDTLGLTIG